MPQKLTNTLHKKILRGKMEQVVWGRSTGVNSLLQALGLWSARTRGIWEERRPIERFRAEKRNKHARDLAGHQAPSLKKWREFRRLERQKKLRTNPMLSQFSR